MRSLLDPLPLRQNTAWGIFAAADSAIYLPHRYGKVGGSLIQYDKARTQFVWADHPVQSIDEVDVNGQPVQGWTWANVNDQTGHPVAMVTFNQPVDDGVTPLARGKGKIHPRTGLLMEDPASVLWDILANLAGRTIAEAHFGDFSRACNARGLVASGSITDSTTPFSACAEVCSSMGAVFASPGDAYLWPGGTDAPALITIAPNLGHTATATSAQSTIVNDLTLQYEYEDGEPRATIQLQAPDSIARFGSRPQTVSAPWLGSARNAFDVANRLLIQQARNQWKVQATGIRRRLNPEQFVNLQFPNIPVTGVALVQDAQLDIGTGLTQISITLPIGSVPRTIIAQQSEAFDPTAYSGVTVTTQGDERVLTLDNEDGSPIANATVTLDNTLTRYTDSAGRVEFPASVMPVGSHTLSIATQDGRTLTTTVLVQ